MTPEALVKAMLARREFWVDLGDGKRVKLRRPAEMDVAGMLVKDDDGKVTGIAASLAEVTRFAVDWEGFTEADLIGPAGASDAVPFDAALWGAAVADRAAWCGDCARALVEAIVEHEKQAAAAAGN